MLLFKYVGNLIIPDLFSQLFRNNSRITYFIKIPKIIPTLLIPTSLPMDYVYSFCSSNLVTW